MLNTSQVTTFGYQLIDRGYSIWQLQTPKGSFTGPLNKVCHFAVNSLGFQIEELERGVIEMERHFHSRAEYGIMKSFIFSYDAEEKDETNNA